MNIKEKEHFLRGKIIPFIEKLGFRVFEMRLFYGSGKLLLRILVDFDQGGIGLDDCALINRKVSDYLDESSFLNESCILEISSPGLTRD
ncbi:ribosome maturation factor RimP, partial [Candidatus Omnitrophota bacterium]